MNTSAPDYRLACDLGYELSKNEFDDMYKYAKLVQKECSNTLETSTLSSKIDNIPIQTLLSSPYSSTSSESLNLNRKHFSEDLWIKCLRELFESDLKE